MESVLELIKPELSGSLSSNAIASNATERNIAKLIVKEVFKLEKYFIAICNDVLVEVLSFGSRLRLGKLECVGRRFNWIVENFFGERPSIRLGFDLIARFTIFLNEIHDLLWYKLVFTITGNNLPFLANYRLAVQNVGHPAGQVVNCKKV